MTTPEQIEALAAMVAGNGKTKSAATFRRLAERLRKVGETT